MAGFTHDAGVDKADGDFDGSQSHHAQHHVDQLGVILIGNDHVGDPLQYQRGHHGHQGGEEHQSQHEQEHFFIGKDVAKGFDQLLQVDSPFDDFVLEIGISLCHISSPHFSLPGNRSPSRTDAGPAECCRHGRSHRSAPSALQRCPARRSYRHAYR